MFIKSNPILAVLVLFVAFDLMRRSYSNRKKQNNLQKYMPSEEKKASQFTAMHQFPYTLEQEIVKKMAPINQTSSTLTQASYKPVLDNTYEATQLY
jgi:hypothetical protein